MGFVTIILHLFGLYFCAAVEYTPLTLRNVMYYGDWSSVQENVLTNLYYPGLLPGGEITHLNFAFLDLDADGNILLTDANASSHNPFGVDGVSWGDPNSGILPALQDLRARYPNLRLGVSVGGWTRSGDFALVSDNPTKRANFVDQMGKFIEYNNLDFMDIDWEYPGNWRNMWPSDNPSDHDEGAEDSLPSDGVNYIQLLRDLKAKESELSLKTKRVYELSVALPASVSTFFDTAQAFLPGGVTIGTATAAEKQTALQTYFTQLFGTIDFGNIMTYDLTGSWVPLSGHHTALYSNYGKNSADSIVSYLTGKTVDGRGNPLADTLPSSVPRGKICVGAAYYTHGFNNVANTGPACNLQPGINEAASIVQPGSNGKQWIEQYGYGALDTLKEDNPGLIYYYDEIAQAPYLYKPGPPPSGNGGTFYTYDNPKSVKAKAKYVLDNQLGGMISWMASQDAAIGTEESGSYLLGETRSVLTSSIKNVLFGRGPLKQFIIHPDPMEVSGAVDVNETTKEFLISVTNNNPANTEAQVTDINQNGLYYSANTYLTILIPKLYITLKSGVNVVPDTSDPARWTQTGTVVTVNLYDFGSKYQFLKPGDTASITLPVTKAGELVSNDIAKIEISKQIYKNSANVVGRVDVTTLNFAAPRAGIEGAAQIPTLSRAMKILMVLALLIAGIGGF